jgi:ankyrin repeat protein
MLLFVAQCLDSLIEDPRMMDVCDAAGRSAIHLAAAYGEVECLELLMEHGVDYK